MPDDELNRWLAQLNSTAGWTVYQIGDEPPPPLVAVNHRHFFTDVVIIRSADTAVAYRTMLAMERDEPPDAAEAMWTYSGDANGAVDAILALTQPARAVRRLPAPPNYKLPTGELRHFTETEGDPRP